MKHPLFVCGAGAVTAAGLDSRQTIAAIRAGLSAFEETMLIEPFGELQIVARIPMHWRLRRTEGEWLVNMAVRALNEALESGANPSEETAVLMTLPETFREHPGYTDISQSNFLTATFAAGRHRFHSSSSAIDGGAAAGIGMLERVETLLSQTGVRQVLLGGVDSLLNNRDISRLAEANRLRNEENSQGLVPGEAAAFVRITREPEAKARLMAAIHGAGLATEVDSALSGRYSQGRALLNALRNAVNGGKPSEPDIVFVVRNSNGERYDGWEQMIAHPRFYRTLRKTLPTAFPAMTVGDVGAASGALALMLAADSFTKGYAPGSVAMCEVASEGGLRAAAVVSRVDLR